MLSVVLISSLATAASAVAAISAHVCRTISNRDKTRSLDHMTQLLKGCPPDECESVAEAIAKVADSLFPQPPPTLADRSPRHRSRGESALPRCRPLDSSLAEGRTASALQPSHVNMGVSARSYRLLPMSPGPPATTPARSRTPFCAVRPRAQARGWSRAFAGSQAPLATRKYPDG